MFLKPFRSLTSAQRRVFAACFLGWTLDAFDFFLLTFCLDSIAATFHVSLATAADSIFWTLCMRPVGALLFGAAGGEVWAAADADAQCADVLGLCVGSAFAPGFGRLPGDARAVWRGDGWGVGRGRGAGAGVAAGGGARILLGAAAGRVCCGESAGCCGVWS